ncbi:MAG: 4Fe-4S dicluster domain-containing protein [Crenarchaeota archaeon]|nr:4Fe-4S dicluster domain-containing protein [Thermoproteota archaeon]
MVRVLLKFLDRMVEEPIIAQLILELKFPINVITAHIDSKGGEVLVEVPQESLNIVIEAFRKKGVGVSVPKLVEFDMDKCISCGSCVTLCPVDAITFTEDFSINFDKEKCVGSTCSACVNACPVKAIRSVKKINNDLNNNHR